jgi:PAT family beta-lactamase induction signal transducer AmpG
MTASASASPKHKHSFREVVASLGKPKVASMLALGFASGLPFLLTGATFGYWLGDEGAALTAIGFLSWVGLAYTFKVFWAPAVDRIRLPILGALGQRRGWVVLAQMLVAAGLLAMAAFGVHGPGGLAAIGAFALLVAFASATQDIAVDAWRIECAPDVEEQSLVTSAFQLGYRAALLVTDALILIFAQHIGWPLSYVAMAVLMGVGLFAALKTPEPERAENAATGQAARASAAPQHRVYAAAAAFAVAAASAYWMTRNASALGEHGDLARASQFGAAFAAVMGVCALGVLAGLGRHVWMLAAAATAVVVLIAFYGAVTEHDLIGGAPMFWPMLFCILGAGLAAPPNIFDAVIGPFVEFFRAHGPWALLMLAMISVYRLPEFIIGPVAGPFYIALGLEKEVVGGVRATVGLIASMAGIAAGGLCAVRLGFNRTLILGAILQGLGVAAYALVAHFGAQDLRLFAAAMASDNFCYAFAGVALVAYMSSLTSVGYTATQYALLSSVYTLFGKFLKGFSGAVVDGLHQTRPLMEAYGAFYLGCGAIALPALVLCLILALRHSPETRAAHMA